ncbi:MAG: NAD kinase [Bacteroidaceae bacterium]|nr:NAD kinase [Bacteroidaceae bacterium]
MEKGKIKYAIFGNSYHKECAASIGQIIQILRRHTAYISIEEQFYHFVRSTLKIDFQPDEIITDNNFSASFAISLGGDGTFLNTAARVGEKEIPIIGINTGRLGFLAEVLPKDFEKLIESLRRGDYFIEHRSLLRVCDNANQLNIYPYALNEVAILKHDNSSMISIRALVDGHYLTTYQADGLLISTPTGSTGYSLSVGGPIISPTSPCIALTPVAPHSLNVRPIILNDDITIRLQVKSRNHNFLTSIDGRSQNLDDHVELMIRRAPYRIHLVKRSNSHFFDTLRNKLLWGADKRI